MNEPMRRRHWRSQSMIDPSVLRLCRSGACLPCGRSSTVHREPALLGRARPMASATKARNIAGLPIGGGAAAEADHWDPHPVQCSDRKGELRARTTGHRWRTVRSRGTPRLTHAVWLFSLRSHRCRESIPDCWQVFATEAMAVHKLVRRIPFAPHVESEFVRICGVADPTAA